MQSSPHVHPTSTKLKRSVYGPGGVGKSEHLDLDQQDIPDTITDPLSLVGEKGGETVILNLEELRKIITGQQSLEVHTVWLTTVQTGFPTTSDENEIDNIKDTQLDKQTVCVSVCYLHPVISDFTSRLQEELTSTRPFSSLEDNKSIELKKIWDKVVYRKHWRVDS